MVKKYSTKKNIPVEKDLLDMMGNPRIFVDDEKVTVDEVKNPIIVEFEGETVALSDDEIEVLKLGPKFCVYVDLDSEEFETDLEESILKVKWDMMTTDNVKTDKGLEDVALEALLGKDVCDKIDEEKEEEQEMKEAEYRTPSTERTCPLTCLKEELLTSKVTAE